MLKAEDGMPDCTTAEFGERLFGKLTSKRVSKAQTEYKQQVTQLISVQSSILDDIPKQRSDVLADLNLPAALDEHSGSGSGLGSAPPSGYDYSTGDGLFDASTGDFTAFAGFSAMWGFP